MKEKKTLHNNYQTLKPARSRSVNGEKHLTTKFSKCAKKQNRYTRLAKYIQHKYTTHLKTKSVFQDWLNIITNQNSSPISQQINLK